MKRPLRILLADDEEIVHQTITSYLSDLGHIVDNAYDVPGTLESIKAHEYDLLIIDIRTPGMNGLSLISRIREMCPRMLMVIIAGRGNMDMVIQALRLGATDFLMKPIRLLELDAVLEKSARILVYCAQQIRDKEALQKVRSELEAEIEDQAEELVKISEKLQIEILRREKAEEALQEVERRYRLLAEGVEENDNIK